MLTKCPECDLSVSDKAFVCPHCGYPLKTRIYEKYARHKPKRQRLPNGFGQISELKGLNLRKPFRAMVTVGKTDDGKPICKLLQPEAYFETYNDAYQALIEYHKNPYIISNTITMGELYDKWFEARSEEWSKSLLKLTKLSWKYCDGIKNIKANEFRPRHIRACIEEGIYNDKKPSPEIKKFIKSTFNKLMDYAVEYEIVDRNYARSFVSWKTRKDKEIEASKKAHISYTDDEISKLWNNLWDYDGVDVLLIQCYSGLRPKEIELLETQNINIEEWTMVGGVKTKAGINRTIPIHSKIQPLIQKYYEHAIKEDLKYVFSRKGAAGKEFQYTYEKFRHDIENIKEKLDLNEAHLPHDGRAHFITQAKRFEVDEYAIKRIVGHNIKDITESVYTKRDIKWLKDEIEKIG